MPCSKPDVLTSEREDDEGGFRSLPSTRSVAKTAAVSISGSYVSGAASMPPYSDRRQQPEREERSSSSATPSPLMPAMLKGAVARNNSLVKALAAGRAERVEGASPCAMAANPAAASAVCQQQGTEVAIQTSPRDGNGASGAKVKRIYI